MAARTPASTHSPITCGTVWRGRDHHDKIHFFRDVADLRIATLSEHFGLFGIDCVELSVERAGAQIFENRAADGSFPFGGSDNGNGFRREKTLKSGAMFQDVGIRINHRELNLRSAACDDSEPDM